MRRESLSDPRARPAMAEDCEHCARGGGTPIRVNFARCVLKKILQSQRISGPVAVSAALDLWPSNLKRELKRTAIAVRCSAAGAVSSPQAGTGAGSYSSCEHEQGCGVIYLAHL